MTALVFGNLPGDMTEPGWFGYGAYFPGAAELFSSSATELNFRDTTSGSTMVLLGSFDFSTEETLLNSQVTAVILRTSSGALLFDWRGMSLTFEQVLYTPDPELLNSQILSGTDIITGGNSGDILRGYAGNDVISGGGSSDLIRGEGGADALNGQTGNDTLDGGAGNDTMRGGAGNDVYIAGASGDAVIENPGEGLDTVRTTVTYTLPDNLEKLILLGMSAINGTGNALANTFMGNGSDNVFTGRGGDDTFSGSGGSDTMTGGPGDDLYTVNSASDVVIERADQGCDTVRSYVTHTLSAQVENLVLTGTQDIDGTGNGLANSITGNSVANLLKGGGSGDVLSGAAGNDTLDGGAGADSMAGGPGDDVYLVNAAGDGVVEHANRGTDTVHSAIAFTLPQHVENLTLTSTAHISGAGNALGNTMIGNGGDNMLAGAGGNDSLIGGAGNDTLNGGSGFDRMEGGPGNDIYFVGSVLPDDSLVMQGEPGEPISQGQHYFFTSDTGTFSVNATWDRTGDGLVDFLRLNYTDSSHWWHLDFGTDGMGQNLAAGDYFDAQRASFAQPGHPGLDVAGDGIGANQVFGSFTIYNVEFDYSGPGPVLVSFSASFEQHVESPDTPALTGVINYNYALVEPVFELANRGIDTVLSSIDYTLPVNVEYLTLTGAADLNGTGNALANSITGNSGANLLSGGGRDDTLDGGTGNDTLVGGGGSDSLIGGSGLDSLIGGGSSDTLLGGGGSDTLVYDGADALIDGGTGADTLGITGGTTLNLSGLAGTVIMSIEITDLTKGNNTLTLALQDVLDISPSTNTLRIDGNAGDTVNAGGGWAAGADVAIDSNTYHSYTQSAATVLIDTDVTHNIFM